MLSGWPAPVFAPVVETARYLVDIPVVSSFSPVMEEAVRQGSRIGIIASVPATLRTPTSICTEPQPSMVGSIETELCLAEELIPLLRTQGEAAFQTPVGGAGQ